ncbi:hypothetical protein N7499_003117 [Penicillium canescens]|uniref:Uncharacterized protein n=1 Tax=Penicillium canescens TaxID=5083 RepID=A0AAD6IAI9_PENCN|nr:hypothetical protein N7460_007108 [Penicillium canescens]KAJ6059903.1 hypothetical protein N7444_003542 [Penicillium canescens]KAJ6093786.1 hypothetical protein N7499_003117 [Penicillium canescens]KAJ6174421.1 hypothetical protein N7485_005487 [Penicillium canescens]
MATRDIPAGVLDKGGYPSRYQERPTRLSLVTGGTCPQSSQESNIRLRLCIRQNWIRLEHLSIGFISSSFSRALCWHGLLQPEPEVGGTGLGSTRNGDIEFGNLIALPALSTPSFLKVALAPDISSGHNAILGLVQLLSRSQKPLQLAHFEFSLIICCSNRAKVVASLLLCAVLMFISWAAASVSEVVQFPSDAIRHYRPTLKSLVYHERQLAPIDADVLFEDDRDVSPARVINLSTIVDLGQMSAPGMCASPSAARLCLRPTAKRSRLQILHLRFSGLNRIPIPREIITFLYETPKGYSQHPRSCCGSVDRDASNDNRDYGPIFDEYFDRSQFDYIDPQQAVFGRDGLPALQVLAFGTSPTAFLMRRVHSSWECSGKVPAGLACDDTTRLSFRPVDMSDYSIWDGAVVDAARFLSAS